MRVLNVLEASKLVLKGTVGLIYDLYVREVPVREDTCPGPSAL